MIIAVDTNILLDVLIADKKYFLNSKKVIEKCLNKGQLIISEIVYAELSCQFKSVTELKGFLFDTSIKLIPSNEKALAGERWREYSRKRLVVL